MISTLFIGFQYAYRNPKAGKSLDSDIFVNSMSKIDDVDAYFFPIDSLSNVELEVKNHLLKNRYDIIFFNLIKNEFPNSLLNFLKDKYVTVNWFGDDQWRFYDFSLKYARYFTYIITTDKFKLNEYRLRGFKNVLLSQWAAISLIPIPEKVDYKYDISFVGAYSISREYVIEYLERKGFKVSVFGKGWNKSISTNEMSEVITKSKINLNLSNSVPTSFDYLEFLFRVLKKSWIFFLKFNFKKSFTFFLKFLKGVKILTYNKTEEQIKARNFEIPANYGFQITKYAIGLEDYYNIGKEIIVFNSLKELKLLCEHYLSNENERRKILNESHKKTLSHTYIHRLKKIINDIS